MRALPLCMSFVAVALGCLPAMSQTTKAPRQPIPVSSSYFASLNSAPKHMVSNKLSSTTSAAVLAADPRIVSVPHFTSSFTEGGTVYPYTMVGSAPQKHQTTLVPTTYVPMSFYFDEFVDKNGNNITIDATAIDHEIKHSPLFENSSYATGFTQFEDAQMRAEFYPLYSHDGDDNYHVLLGHPETLTPVTIEVPVGSALVTVDPNGTYYALIDIKFLISQLNTLTQTEGLDVHSIPIFLTRNAVYGDFFDGQPLDCCYGGFHIAYEAGSTPNRIFVQTLVFATSLDPEVSKSLFGDAALFSDINGLSHELGETLNDPFANNITPSFQLPGAAPGICGNLLEVGDIVEDLVPDYTEITLHGFTYHPQTLGLLQWFEGITPSNAINKDYSFPDPTKLTAPFTPCPGS